VPKYVELVRNDNIPNFPTPISPGFHEVFDNIIDTTGWREIRVWVHVFIENYASTPVTSAARLNVRFLHPFGRQLGGGGQFDYARRTIYWNNLTSFINGYVTVPLIGDRLRILCTPENLPTGPYSVFVTYYLV
jgi:hypothetical protein